MFYTWKKIADPSTGWLASKTSGWTADSFSGGLEVDFSSVVPAGTKAVRVFAEVLAGSSNVLWYRKYNDSNISNTPVASSEESHRIQYGFTGAQTVVWLSADGKAQFAVTDTACDVYMGYPVEYLS